MPPEEHPTGRTIDRQRSGAGWYVPDFARSHIRSVHGIAIQRFTLRGYDFAGYLLYVDGKADPVVEVKKQGVPRPGSSRGPHYTKSLSASLPTWADSPLFPCKFKGVEACFAFISSLNPEPRLRPTNAVHQPAI